MIVSALSPSPQRKENFAPYVGKQLAALFREVKIGFETNNYPNKLRFSNAMTSINFTQLVTRLSCIRKVAG
jgi:hypothetical protein